MMRDEKLERTIERAIQSAFVDFPDAGNGTVWPKTYCHSACNIGSDSFLMQFERCLAL